MKKPNIKKRTTKYKNGKDDSVILNTIAYNKYKNNLPNNLKHEDYTYDLYGAFKAGLNPELQSDGTYHLGSRDPKTGKILKSTAHPTFSKAVYEDMKMGYYPVYKNGNIYTKNPFQYKSGKDSIWDKYSKFNDSFASIPVKFLDPTGISSWKDVYDAWTDKDLNVADALLETAGAVPLIGKIAKIGKAAKILSKDKNLFKTQDYILRGIGTSHDVQQQIKKYKDGKDQIELKPVKNWKYVDDGSGNMNIVDTDTGKIGTFALPDVNINDGGINRQIQEKRLQDLINHSEINPITGKPQIIGVPSVYPEFDIISLGQGLVKPTFSFVKNNYNKQSLVRSIYNNIAPGSYYDSYIKNGTKKDEIINTVKDFITGNAKEINPKWEDWMKTTSEGFIVDKRDTEKLTNIFLEARKEAWKNYLGIPHEDKYLINTGSFENGIPIYRSNLSVIPNRQLRHIVKQVGKQEKGIPDYINTTGGVMGVAPKELENSIIYNTYDLWDLNPFKDANRARILPNFIRKPFSHIEVQPDGYEKVVWNKNAPEILTEFEPSKYLKIPGPFLNKTSFRAKKLNKEDLIKDKQLIPEQEFVNNYYDVASNLIPFQEMDEKTIKNIIEKIKEDGKKQYHKLLETDPKKVTKYKNYTEDELLNKYGIFYNDYNNGKDSGIHIKKANVGKFTKAAEQHGMSVQQFANKVLKAPKGKYSSTLRKRANFARNAKNFNH